MVKHILGINRALHSPQPRHIIPKVHLLRHVIDPGVRIVDVHPPLPVRKLARDALHEPVQKPKALFLLRGIVPGEDAVVELEQEELVAVGVGRGVVRDLGDARVGAAVYVDQDPPGPGEGALVEEGVGCVEPVVDEGFEGGAGKSVGCQGF